MRRKPAKKQLRVEMLEDRQMLAATADIVLIVDVSESANDIRNWSLDTFENLETTLVDRGIGVDLANRYSVITFSEQADQNEHKWTFHGWESSSVEDATGIIQNSGGAVALNADGFEALFNESDLNFEFRNNAAVHFVMVTNGGNETVSRRGPTTAWKAASPTPYDVINYGDIIDVLSKPELLDENDGPNLVSDATMTVTSSGRRVMISRSMTSTATLLWI